jgi:histidinol-phosphatase (PHP family)
MCGVGLESDFFPGVEPWLERLHARVPLHHVLGSVHMQMAPYRAVYYKGDSFAYQQVYFEHLAAGGGIRTLRYPRPSGSGQE